MEENNKPQYSGNLFREARSKKRLRYKRLASNLNLPENYLVYLEEDRYQELPGPTYVRGYIRAYSKELGIKPDLILEGYDLYLRDQRKKIKKEKKEASKERKKQEGIFNFLSNETLIMILLVIALIVIYFYSGIEKPM
tara:strand:- start:114 stop:527 length:414 start_codon:yes stop_codon:yes gene_type:complete